MFATAAQFQEQPRVSMASQSREKWKSWKCRCEEGPSNKNAEQHIGRMYVKESAKNKHKPGADFRFRFVPCHEMGPCRLWPFTSRFPPSAEILNAQEEEEAKEAKEEEEEQDVKDNRNHQDKLYDKKHEDQHDDGDAQESDPDFSGEE